MAHVVRLGIVAATLGAGLVLCASILGDFGSSSGGDANGDSGPLAEDGSGGGGGENDATTSNDAPAVGAPDATVDGVVVSPGNDGGGSSDSCAGGGCADVSCPATKTACGGVCVDLTSSPTSCGRCGHDCGGSTCVNSACVAQPLVTGIDNPTGFAIDPTSIYFAVDNVLKSCPLAGCATGSTQLASYTNLNGVQVTNGTVAFVATVQIGNHPTTGLYSCPVAGCVNPVQIQSALIAGGFPATLAFGPDLYFISEASFGAPQTASLQRCIGLTSTGTGCSSIVAFAGSPSYPLAPIAADLKNVYFAGVLPEASDNPAGIVSCPNGAPCTIQSPLTPSLGFDPSLMAIANGVVYFVGPRDLGTGGTLYSCPTTGCTSAASLDRVPMSITSLAADLSGLYFTGTNGSVSGLFTCPLAGCGTVGPVALVTGESAPTSVLTDPKFIYWVDATADGGLGGASILRVAK